MWRGIYANLSSFIRMAALRKQAVALLFLIAASLPAFCAEPVSCPWLNAATAGGFLGGTAIATVKALVQNKNKDDFTCLFTHHKGSITATLRIEVTTLVDPMASHPHDAFESRVAACGKTALALEAIGNEAASCSRRKSGALGERVIGRVRNRIFLLDISSNAPHMKQSDLRDRAEQISEQVAGILF